MEKKTTRENPEDFEKLLQYSKKFYHNFVINYVEQNWKIHLTTLSVFYDKTVKLHRVDYNNATVHRSTS